MAQTWSDLVGQRARQRCTRPSRRLIVQAGLALAGVGLLSSCMSVPSLPWSRGRVPRIGFLSPNAGGPAPTTDAFLSGLRDLGYVEGQSITIDWRFAEGQDDRLPVLAQELVDLRPDAIVTFARGVQAAAQVTSTVPIVAAQVGDLVATGLADSLAHPGGNVTGLTALAPQLAGKRLEFARLVFPQMARAGALWNPEEPGMVLEFGEARAAARSLAIELHSFEVRDPGEFTGVFQAALGGHLEALFLVVTTFFIRNRTRLVDLAATTHLPTMSGDPEFARAGGLMAYGPNGIDFYRRAATYVDKIIKGAKPGDLPIEQPTVLDFVVNLQTAGTLGITIPESILNLATEVIQ